MLLFWCGNISLSLYLSHLKGYSIITYNQTVTSTPNFGNTKPGFSSPDVPPCTQNFVSVVVDPTNFASIFNLQPFFAWDAQSCITTCVNTCTKTAPAISTEQAAWCLVVSNPNNGAVFLRISYTFTDPTSAVTVTVNSTPTIITINGGVSPTTTSNTNESSSLTHTYTATIKISS
ncbi:4812_t:CDS:2, partial [Paraglomus occultum]